VHYVVQFFRTLVFMSRVRSRKKETANKTKQLQQPTIAGCNSQRARVHVTSPAPRPTPPPLTPQGHRGRGGIQGHTGALRDGLDATSQHPPPPGGIQGPVGVTHLCSTWPIGALMGAKLGPNMVQFSGTKMGSKMGPKRAQKGPKKGEV